MPIRCRQWHGVFFHHTILLPGEALAWSAERLRLVIAHELAHIRRRDALTQVIVQLASAMYWFNPLVWYAAYRIREERERASDDCVLGLGIEGSDYAHHLLQIARDVARASLPSTVAMAHRSNLEDRLRAILENHRDRRPPSLRTAVTGMTAVLVATTLLANLQLTARSATPTALTAEAESPKAGPSPEVRAAQALQIPPVYRTWLNEDVLYIIATEEKAAFLSLQSDEERNLFIDQFWSHRDPTPATPTNEFREEHYQRIAYANARFGAASKPGWQTDRGRLYILHGKPDELDSHPNAGAVRHPYEIWTYKYVEGIGNNVAVEFVDSTGNGDYRLAANPDEKFQAATPVNGPPQFSFRFLQAAAAAQPFTLHLPFALSFAPSAATLRFKYSDLAFQTAGGTHTARLHLLGEVVNSVGAPALHFEDSIEKPVPDFLFSQTLQTEGVYRKPLSLTSGEYRLSVVVEDLNSGRLGMATITMRIP